MRKQPRKVAATASRAPLSIFLRPADRSPKSHCHLNKLGISRLAKVHNFWLLQLVDAKTSANQLCTQAAASWAVCCKCEL